MDRRDFAKRIVAPLVVPASVFGANDRPAYAAIGTGGRGTWLHETFQKLGAQCVAVCDVYQPHCERAASVAPRGVKQTADHREVLAMPGLDFVIIATPDHHHKPQLLDALAAGKDVYLEKPFSMNLAESAEMVTAVERSGRLVQVGMQRRSMPFIYQAKKVIDDGGLGKVSLVKANWNWHFDIPLVDDPLPGNLDWERFQGPAPRREFMPRRFRWWRGFWDYSGGNMTDQGTHLMDVVQWMTGNGAPKSAVCQGYLCDAVKGEVPDVFSAVFEYPKMMATWTLNYTSAFDYDWSITFMGDRATMVMNRHGYALYKDPGASRAPWSQKEEMTVSARVEDRDSANLHQKNFLDCLRTRQQPNCTAAIAARAVAGPHMANVAWREGRKVSA
jgi:predicted dehydrogenase